MSPQALKYGLATTLPYKYIYMSVTASLKEENSSQERSM